MAGNGSTRREQRFTVCGRPATAVAEGHTETAWKIRVAGGGVALVGTGGSIPRAAR